MFSFHYHLLMTPMLKMYFFIPKHVHFLENLAIIELRLHCFRVREQMCHHVSVKRTIFSWLQTHLFTFCFVVLHFFLSFFRSQLVLPMGDIVGGELEVSKVRSTDSSFSCWFCHVPSATASHPNSSIWFQSLVFFFF